MFMDPRKCFSSQKLSVGAFGTPNETYTILQHFSPKKPVSLQKPDLTHYFLYFHGITFEVKETEHVKKKKADIIYV